VRDAPEIVRAIDTFAGQPNGGLIVLPDPIFSAHRRVIVGLAAKHRLPSVYPFRAFAADGGLVAYGVDLRDQFRRSADYVDRILRGASPAQLPVQAPDKFELTINLRTAKALGIEVPAHLQQVADEVIE
jgi:putative ABC transport system substrate-binding protein